MQKAQNVMNVMNDTAPAEPPPHLYHTGEEVDQQVLGLIVTAGTQGTNSHLLLGRCPYSSPSISVRL